MLTDRGWAALGAALALVILWAALGEPELLGIGALLGVGAVVAALFVRRSHPRVAMARRLSPALVHEGDHAMVAASILNDGRRSIWNVELEDEVSGLGSATFAAGRIHPGETVTATYQILCRPRGIYTVGPAYISSADPLRLAQTGTHAGADDRLIVYPALESLEGFPIVSGQDPTVHAVRPEFKNQGGEDFFTLREYQVGDDLRRVHWPSSAKRDELMIRQLETPWQSRAMIIMDTRAGSYESVAAFEKAVRGAASVVHHLYEYGFEADLWAGGGLSSQDRNPYARSMETLAAIQTVPEVDLRAGAARLRHRGRGGALVIVTGLPDDDAISIHSALANDYTRTVVMGVSDRQRDLARFHEAGMITVVIRADESWSDSWMRSMQGGMWSTASVG